MRIGALVEFNDTKVVSVPLVVIRKIVPMS